jgi:DNA mismatch repair protein MutS
MEQYGRLKAQHPDAILFFRLGDFYEMFDGDAELAARLLGLTLTSRNKNDPQPIPLAGVPWHQRDLYVRRLLRLGHKVAICEQLEDAAQARGLVDRGVTEILTPGSLLAEAFLEAGESRYLAALAFDGTMERVGFALVDASTGEFRYGEAPLALALEELARYTVAEWLLPEAALPPRLEARLGDAARSTTPAEADGASFLTERFGDRRVSGPEGETKSLAESAAAAAARYLDRVSGGVAVQLRPPQWIEPQDALSMSEATRQSLDLFPRPGQPEGASLWPVIDRTASGAGGRRLRRWLERPLLEPARIEERLDAVGTLLGAPAVRERLRASLRETYDLERLTARLAASRSTPRELGALRRTLALVPRIAEALGEPSGPLPPRLDEARAALDPHTELEALLALALVDDPPPVANEGGILRTGYDAECDRLRAANRSGKTWIVELETAERLRTGIPSLKVGYNRVFGYYLEITKAHQARVPADYERRQTLTGAERYVTPELKRLEGEVLGAEEKLRRAEAECFAALRESARAHVDRLRETANALADLDALAALAEAAARYGYVRPRVHGGDRIEIRAGRHPVVERALPPGRFVPNDVVLDPSCRQILLITGPNMAGKSTYLRTVGLLVVLAQAGSFVPAESAEIGVVDRIFTRVGAADALAAGHSTFMVEMVEVAALLRDSTPRSLVLLDEVGRGTSTYDGLALAWAIAEELHAEAGPHPRTLFATHYHELTRLAHELPRLANVHVRVREVGEDVVFLHEVAEGPADRSYGIHVARLAGLPPRLLARARRLLADLESQRAHALPADRSPLDPQIGLFEERAETSGTPLAPEQQAILDELAAIDLDEVSPRAALDTLAKWKSRVAPEKE